MEIVTESGFTLGEGGLWDLKAKMLEDLFDHLLILDETNDLHPPLTFGAR
jgi:hypothetical protein